MAINKELIKSCLSNDRLAQRQLYDLLLPYLTVVCKRYLNNNADLKDTLQESFISIFSKINQYDIKRSQFKTWAVRISINCCLKCNQHSAKTSTKELNIEQHNSMIDPEILAQYSDEDLLLFLKKMPLKHFEVFNLHVIDGFSHKEISELLGINIALSRKRLSRAKEWLSSKKNTHHLKSFQLLKLNN